MRTLPASEAQPLKAEALKRDSTASPLQARPTRRASASAMTVSTASPGAGGCAPAARHCRRHASSSARPRRMT